MISPVFSRVSATFGNLFPRWRSVLFNGHCATQKDIAYHVFSKFLRRVDIWCEIKLIEIFCQLADICCTRRFRHLADRAELHEILFLEIGTYLT